MIDSLSNAEFFKYYRQTLEDVSSMLLKGGDTFSSAMGSLLYSPTSPSKIERTLSKRMEIPEELKDILRSMYSEIDEVTLRWNLREWEGEYSYVGNVEIPPITGLFSRNLNAAKDVFWRFDPDKGRGEIGYYEELGLKGKALRGFRSSLPKMYVFDRYAGEDAWAVIWVKGGKYGIALITSQGEEVLPFPYGIRKYLYLQLRTLGVFHFPELVLTGCSAPDISCIMGWIETNYDLNTAQRRALEELYRSVHRMMDDVSSTLLRAYTPWGKKTTPEVR